MNQRIEMIESKILTGHPTYIRHSISEPHILNLMDVYKDAAEWPFPPVHVIPIPSESENPQHKKDHEKGFRFYVVDGVHRTSASLNLGKPVRAIIHPSTMTEQEIIVMQIKENIHRDGLTLDYHARAAALSALKATGMTLEQIAEKTGIHLSSVSRIIRGKQATKGGKGDRGKKGKRGKAGTKKVAVVKFSAEAWQDGLKNILSVYKKYRDRLIKELDIPADVAKVLDLLLNVTTKKER